MKCVLTCFVLLVLLHSIVVNHYGHWDWLLGAVFAVVMLCLFRGFLFSGKSLPRMRNLFLRFIAFVPLCLATIVLITRGTWQVTLVVLNLRPLPQSGLVTVPIDEMTPTGVSVIALITTLSPGTVFLDVDWENKTMLFHSLDASDPAKVRADIHRFYQRYQRFVFP